MSLPNFLGIGAQKAGTSWLYKMLTQHPDVWMPPIKELHFFDHLFIESERQWTRKFIKSSVDVRMVQHLKRGSKRLAGIDEKSQAPTERRTPDRPKAHVNYQHLRYLLNIASREPFTEKWYRRIFDLPAARGKVLGEITPAYSTIPIEGVRFVRRLLNKARIIYIIRDPIERALSQLRMNVSLKRQVPNSYEQWAEWACAEEVRSRSDYEKFVPLWQAIFPAEQLLFIPFGDIARDPTKLLRQIEGFIGVRPIDNYKHLETKFNKTTSVAIPSEVIDLVSRDTERQKKFLISQFGEDFASRAATPPMNGIGTMREGRPSVVAVSPVHGAAVKGSSSDFPSRASARRSILR